MKSIGVAAVDDNRPPDHFGLDDIIRGLERAKDTGSHCLSLGLLLKARKALIRLAKKRPADLLRLLGDRISSVAEDFSNPVQFKRSVFAGTEITGRERMILAEAIQLFLSHVCNDEGQHSLRMHWTAARLEMASYEMSRKEITLSPRLQRELDFQPLIPSRDTHDTCFLHFEPAFLAKVRAYHLSVERPAGTFSLDENKSFSESENSRRILVDRLAQCDREVCPCCGRRQQIYCGGCGGLRMTMADKLLPDRISLPFDILLLVHWAESLHKCTGVHASALCTAGTVEIIQWEKHGEEFGDTWGHMVASLDPENDVVLFPAPDATPAQLMKWTVGSSSGGDISGSKRRMRLVVLEASWSHGKTMYNFISQYRQAQELAPLRCVALKDIVGQYWRFHEEGNSAVSTIEAIAHTAEAAGSSSETLQGLTVLFQLQRHRVLSSVAGSDASVLKVGGGAGGQSEGIEKDHKGPERIKKPRAVAVSGSPGLGDWGQVPGYYDNTEDSFSGNEDMR